MNSLQNNVELNYFQQLQQVPPTGNEQLQAKPNIEPYRLGSRSISVIDSESGLLQLGELSNPFEQSQRPIIGGSEVSSIEPGEELDGLELPEGQIREENETPCGLTFKPLNNRCVKTEK